MIIEIKNWMKKGIVYTNKNKNIVQAAKIMANKNVGSLVIMDGSKAIGILTVTDILKRVVAKNLDLNKTKIKDIMSKNLITASSNQSFMQVSKLMQDKKIKHLLITENNKIVGIITSTDVVKLMSGGVERKVIDYESNKKKEH